MGATQSSTLPSREEILRKTKGGRDIVNQVFDWMVSRADLKELYSLANPEQCKRYVFVTADALDVLFKKIQLEPKEGPRGTIFFAKTEDLTEDPLKDSAKGRYRRIICLKLAFLYVRIFQVFAALALSILDVDPQAELKLYDELGRFKGYDENIPLFGPRRVARGGGLSSSKQIPSILEPFRSSLDEVPGDNRFYKFGYYPVYLDTSPLDSDSFRVRYQYKTDTATKQLKARMRIDIREAEDEIYLTMSEIKDPKEKNVAESTLKFKRTYIGEPFRDKNKYTFGQALDTFFKSIIKGDYVDRAFGQERNEYGRFKAVDDKKEPSGVAEGLRTKILLEAFSKTVPVKAHCVSRALQLLSDKGLQTAFPKEIYSSICQTKFMTNNHSLPPSGESVIKSYGMYALAQLFYDTLPDIAPAISAETKEQYNKFLAQMKFVFEEEKVEKNPPKTLSDVKNKLPSRACDKESLDHTLKITNRDVIRQVRVFAKELIDQQIAHTANVVRVLKKLFLLPIESGKPLQIHPNVKKNGLEEVNRIAAEAREVLIDYYSKCEITYRRGAEVIADHKKLAQII
jgi:hypothetical protein